MQRVAEELMQGETINPSDYTQDELNELITILFRKKLMIGRIIQQLLDL